MGDEFEPGFYPGYKYFAPLGPGVTNVNYRAIKKVPFGWHLQFLLVKYYKPDCFTFCRYFFASSVILGNKFRFLSFAATKVKRIDSGTFINSFDFITLDFMI